MGVYGKYCNLLQFDKPRSYKAYSCSTQMSMKFHLLVKVIMLKIKIFLRVKFLVGAFIMLINVKMPALVGILTFMSRI